LVTVIFLVALLMVMGLVFSDKVLRATRDVALAAARDQGVQAAGAGIEWARRQLAETYRDSRGWADYLAAAPAGDGYPETPAFTFEVTGAAVEIYLRDNPDGDDDPRRDNDLQLFVLARARPRRGSEILVESLCRYQAPVAAHGPAGGEDGSQAAAAGLAAEWNGRVRSFHVTD
jgi:hypothetical protein